MDSLYFTELVERSENTTQQENGEYICSCGNWEVASSQKRMCDAKWVRQGSTCNSVHICSCEENHKNLFLLKYLLGER
jgi:hypothetical protein